jgi:hypothetical protein
VGKIAHAALVWRILARDQSDAHKGVIGHLLAHWEETLQLGVFQVG